MPRKSRTHINGAAKSYLIHWSTDYDILGATYYSEIAVCDIGGNTWSVTRITHAQPQAAVANEQFNLFGYGAGVSLFNGGFSALDYFRIGCRFHSTTEAAEDWVAETSPPTITGASPTVELAPNSTSFYAEDPSEDVSNTLLDEGSYAGPIEYAGNINAVAQRRRLYSPILSIYCNAPPLYNDTFFPDNMWRQVATAGTYSTLKITPAHTYWRPLGAGAWKARVRVQVQCYLEAGAPGGSAVSVKLAVVSFNAKPTKKAPATHAVGCAVLTITDNHTDSGVGQWYDLGAMSGVLVKDGGTWLCLAVGFGTGTGHASIRAKIKAISVEPYQVEE